MTPAAWLFIVCLILATAAIGWGLGWLAQRLNHAQDKQQQWVETINAQLPQLQCGDCGYAGCRPYAAAIAAGQAGLDLCPPGGVQTAERLAQLLNTTAPPIAPAPPPLIATINTDRCVGCTLCLAACPTDAIIGSARHTHVVISEHCVGCQLCLPPCPVDCIEMVAADRAQDYACH